MWTTRLPQQDQQSQQVPQGFVAIPVVMMGLSGADTALYLFAHTTVSVFVLIV